MPAQACAASLQSVHLADAAHIISTTLPEDTIKTLATKLAASAGNCSSSLFVTLGFGTCRRLSEAGKQQGRVTAPASPTLDQKLEKKLGGFGQDGLHPAQNKPKQGSQKPSQQGPAASVPQKNRCGSGTAK